MNDSNKPRVKSLAWHADSPLDGVERFMAGSVVGRYSVWGHTDSSWSWSNSLSGGSGSKSYSTAEEAKAAAQSDFADKVLSALDDGSAS